MGFLLMTWTFSIILGYNDPYPSTFTTDGFFDIVLDFFDEIGV